MRYTISNISHKSHDLDEQIICFYFDVNFTEPEKLEVKNYLYEYGELMRYLCINYPDFANYLETVRSSIDGWGPCEHKIMEEMGEEAQQQVYQYLEEYLLQADWVPKLFEHEKERQNQTLQEQVNTQKAVEKIVADLGAMRQP